MQVVAAAEKETVTGGTAAGVCAAAAAAAAAVPVSKSIHVSLELLWRKKLVGEPDDFDFEEIQGGCPRR